MLHTLIIIIISLVLVLFKNVDKFIADLLNESDLFFFVVVSYLILIIAHSFFSIIRLTNCCLVSLFSRHSFYFLISEHETNVNINLKQIYFV